MTAKELKDILDYERLLKLIQTEFPDSVFIDEGEYEVTVDKGECSNVLGSIL